MEAAGSFDDARAARYALAVLTFINLFNYLDRWVVAAVVESIKKSELHLSDTQLGFIATGFIIVYTLTSPLFGTFGDRTRRPPLIAIGVAVWSVATSLAGFARGFVSMFLSRSAVGVGEAAYGTIAPALLADFFPLERRGRVMAIFFMAIPVGSAAGYALGGTIDQHFGWRAAFWIAGAPGIVLSLLVLAVKDPPRQGGPAKKTPAATYLHLLHNRRYLLTALGYGAYTFALGGLGFWMPAFLERMRGEPHQFATTGFGIMTACTGLIGTFIGGWLGDRFLKRNDQAYLWVSGIATFIAAPLTWVGLSNPHRNIYLPAIAAAQLLIFMCTGPVNSAIVTQVDPNERASALGMSILLMHLVGDIPSPPLIGYLSDRSTLEHAFLIVPVAIVLAGVIWIVAARWRDA
jgi:MFS family permease